MDLIKAAKINERWVFAKVCGRDIIPLGYCAPYKSPYWAETRLRGMSDNQIAAMCSADCACYHDGHETAQEAADCYRKYLLDKTLSLMKCGNRDFRCEICGDWTMHYAQVADIQKWYLCPKHNTRQHIESLFKIEEDQIFSSEYEEKR